MFDYVLKVIAETRRVHLITFLRFHFTTVYQTPHFNRISGKMISILVSSAEVDSGFEPRFGQVGICCFSSSPQH